MIIKSENFSKIYNLLKLDKPLVFFDLETTGLNISSDRIIEIAYVKITSDGVGHKNDIFLNPQTPISEESMVIHGITDEMVADKPKFSEKVAELWDVFNDCYYSGFNILKFDLPLLRREFIRAGYDFTYNSTDVVDAKVIYHAMEPRTLSAALRFYCNREHAEAHNALADVEATVDVLACQLEKYEQVRDHEFLRKLNRIDDDDRFVGNDRKFYWKNGEAYFAFSKHRDKLLREVAEADTSFLEWMLRSDFSEETKLVVQNALNGVFPKKQ